MEFILVRHGEAKTELEDPLRPLSEMGRHDVETVSSYVLRMGYQPEWIHHSGKLRAEQTAQIIAGALYMNDRVKAVSGLSPNDDIVPVAESLCAEEKSLMIVSHLPFLSRLLGLLVLADPDKELINYHSGTVVCLKRDDAVKFPAPGRGWIIGCVISPCYLRRNYIET
jgi:phosphohistidine phosphatase